MKLYQHQTSRFPLPFHQHSTRYLTCQHRTRFGYEFQYPGNRRSHHHTDSHRRIRSIPCAQSSSTSSILVATIFLTTTSRDSSKTQHVSAELAGSISEPVCLREKQKTIISTLDESYGDRTELLRKCIARTGLSLGVLITCIERTSAASLDKLFQYDRQHRYENSFIAIAARILPASL